MHHFAHRDGRLFAEEVPLEDIAREVGTPLYCYSSATLERHFHAFEDINRAVEDRPETGGQFVYHHKVSIAHRYDNDF